jgi:hypothetical protein
MQGLRVRLSECVWALHLRRVTTLNSAPNAAPFAPPPPRESPEGQGEAGWRKLIGSALFEAAFVVLGVVLALAANEWRQARVHRAEGENARTAIANELRANRHLLDSARIYHRRVIGTIFSSPPDTKFDAQTFRGGFIQPAQVSTTAWEVASETGALSHIPYPEVLAISQVVALERRYDAMALSTGQLIYGELYRVGPNGVAANARNLASILGSFTYREDQVIRQIDSTLALLSRR